MITETIISFQSQLLTWQLQSLKGYGIYVKIQAKTKQIEGYMSIKWPSASHEMLCSQAKNYHWISG